MALSLISAFSGKWQPEKYKDTYTAALRKVVRAKVEGKEVHRVAQRDEEAPPDLMDALRASVEQMRGSSRRPSKRGAGRGGTAKRRSRSTSRR
jgi:DNA end-binding protein Ku